MNSLLSVQDIEELNIRHTEACKNKQSFFTHPKSGLSVATAYRLSKQRNGCCGNSCMMCPFGHENVVGHTCDKITCKFVTTNAKNIEPTEVVESSDSEENII